MGSLTHWDDLIHGTLVFGAAVPFALALLLGWWLPGRLWIAVAGALIVPVGWIFGRPSWPLHGSDDTVTSGLAAAIALVALEPARDRSTPLRGAGWLALCAAVWAGLGGLLFPAWLAAEGGLARRLLVAGAMGISIPAWTALAQALARDTKGESEPALRLTPAAWVPPAIALAVLLQLGGATRFAQCAGALAASTAGVCVLLIQGRGQAGLRPLAALWAMLSALLAWSGWLFAEIQIGPTLGLLLAPVAAVAARRLPLPCRTKFQGQLWDTLAAAAIAALVIAAGWHHYSQGSDSSGY